jgi:hypothetical protein
METLIYHHEENPHLKYWITHYHLTEA